MKKVPIILFICVLFISGCEVKKVEDIKDNEKFAKEFNITTDNNFKYVSYDKMMDILENKTGIIFFANGDCEWCLATAELLNASLDYKDVKDNIYYYNPKAIKDDSNEKYKKLLKVLNDYLAEDDKGNKELLLPDIYFVRDGKIIGHNNDLATIKTDPNEYLSNKRIKQIKERFEDLISKYNVKECKTC